MCSTTARRSAGAWRSSTRSASAPSSRKTAMPTKRASAQRGILSRPTGATPAPRTATRCAPCSRRKPPISNTCTAWPIHRAYRPTAARWTTTIWPVPAPMKCSSTCSATTPAMSRCTRPSTLICASTSRRYWRYGAATIPSSCPPAPKRLPVTCLAPTSVSSTPATSRWRRTPTKSARRSSSSWPKPASQINGDRHHESEHRPYSQLLRRPRRGRRPGRAGAAGRRYRMDHDVAIQGRRARTAARGRGCADADHEGVARCVVRRVRIHRRRRDRGIAGTFQRRARRHRQERRSALRPRVDGGAWPHRQLPPIYRHARRRRGQRMNAATAIVTGAGRGIGRAAAIRLARDFGRVIIVARTIDALEDTAARIREAGAEPLVVAEDLRRPEAAARIVALTLEKFGRIDALVNVAGAVAPTDLFAMSDAEWDDGYALKFHGARRLTIQAWDALKQARGAVVLTPAPAHWRRRPQRRQSAPSTPQSTRWPRRSPSAASPTACKSTACFRGRC